MQEARERAHTHNHIEVSVSWTKMHTNTCAHASASIDKVDFVCLISAMDGFDFVWGENRLFKVWDEKDEMKAFNEFDLIFVSGFYR